MYDNGAVLYSDYDARGHATRIVDGPNDLGYVYDRAGRLAHVLDNNQDWRTLKSFVYGTGNTSGNLANGKLVRATAHNYVNGPGFPDDFRVTHDYTYGGLGGRVSSRVTTAGLEGGPTGLFTMDLSFNELGQLEQLIYPHMAGAGCGSQENVVLEDETVTDTRTEEACRSVTAEDYHITDPGEVTFRAGEEIALGDGFSVGSGASFTAAVNPNLLLEDTAPSRTVTNTYSEGLLAAVSGGTTQPVTLSYHANGMLNQIARGNTTTDTLFKDPDDMGRPASIRTTGLMGVMWETGSFAYDGSGNVKAMGADTFLYDPVSRLREGTVIAVGEMQCASYDGFGNIKGLGTSSGPSCYPSDINVDKSNNRISGPGYDSAGNMTSWGEGSYTYTYDWYPTGQMRGYDSNEPESDWQKFSYDAHGERIGWFDRGELASHYTLRGLDGKVLRQYVESVGVWTWEKDYVYRDGQHLAQADPSGERHLHLDHLGTIRVITSSTGAYDSVHHYYPFGQEASSVTQNDERMKFTGHERDIRGTLSSTTDDLDYMHARYFNPNIARFLSIDPGRAKPRAPQSWNRYGYALGNPVKYIDPDGKEVVLVVRNDSGGGMTNFGHTAVRVYGKGYDVTYDFGRYGRAWGLLSSKGEGILRVWNNWKAFVKTQTPRGDLRLSTFSTTPQQDQEVMAFFQKRAQAGTQQPVKSGGAFEQFKLTQDYDLKQNNCTTLSLEGTAAAGDLPGLDKVEGVYDPRVLFRALDKIFDDELGKFVSVTDVPKPTPE